MASFWKLIGGDGQQSGDQVSTDVQTIERLCDRVHSSTLLEDRRDAVRALKSLSRKFRLEVGSRAFDILIPVLENDRSDAEITGYALETMCNVMSNEPLDGEEENPNIPEDLGSQFTDIFIQTVENVSLLLSFLEEYDFHVRWPAVRLITVLLSNQGRDMQEIVLSNPMGISKLMDLLVDSREIIRNDGLLLLIQLTKGNTNIQKIVAFENGFERLLEIIHEEGNSDGGIVVEDCLLLLLNLLKTNTSNQNFFKEGSFIPRLPPYFELQPADQNAQNNWSAQKVSNIHLMLQLVRTLVSPNNPQQQTASCQKAVNQCGLLEKLCTILMASGVPADVLTETINTVSEIIRGNQGNQEYFASVMAPSNPPRPAIVVLLMSMVNEKQPFVLRCAVLYCFQSFLYKNELGQSQIIQTLLPTTAEVNAISAGQLLCGGLFSTDPLSTWFAAVALQHAIVDNNTQKEQLLRVQLATSIGNPPVSLLQQCTNILAQGGKVQTRVGLLMLLCHWLAHCPIAVTHFLHNTANVPFLISQVSSSEGDELELVVQGICAFLLGICVLFNNDQVENCQKNDLRQMIEKRIGLENFTDKLSQVSKHESYSKAAKKPQINYKLSSEVLFDYIFTRLFKTLENEVLKALSPVQEDEAEVGKKQAMLDQHESIVQQYKKLIREQDEQLNQLRADLKNNSDKDKTVEDMQQQIQQLKDQNALLKAQRGAGGANASGDLNVLTRLQQEMEDMTKQVQEKNQQIETLKGEKTAAEAKALLGSQIEDKPSVSEADTTALQANITRLNTDIDGLRKKLSQKEEEVKLYKNKYEDSSKQVAELREQVVSGSSQDSANSALVTERNSLISRITELENAIQTLERENKVTKDSKTELEQKIESICQDNSTLQDKIKKLEAEKTKAEDFKKETVEELDGVKKEQEDLLVLLADQDTKLADYKNRLKELGQQVDEDEDEDDLDDFEDEDEVDPDED